MKKEKEKIFIPHLFTLLTTSPAPALPQGIGMLTLEGAAKTSSQQRLWESKGCGIPSCSSLALTERALGRRAQ